jgi:hypothetical protein
MRKLIPVLAPLGRLHDPLGYLAERVHRALAFQRRIVTVDDKGRVFADAGEGFVLAPGRALVGTYDVFTRIPTIEADLRHALRERASRWIVDWDTPMQVREEVLEMARVPPPRRRRRRVAAEVDGKRVPRRPAANTGIRAPA